MRKSRQARTVAPAYAVLTVEVLAEVCRDDADLRRDVESLLAQEHTPLAVDRGMATVAAALLEDMSCNPVQDAAALSSKSF